MTVVTIIYNKYFTFILHSNSFFSFAVAYLNYLIYKTTRKDWPLYGCIKGWLYPPAAPGTTT